MKDGLCSENLKNESKYKTNDNLETDEYYFDIGMKSFNELHELIRNHDIIFWNGTLGVVENDQYKQGSELLVNTLIQELTSFKEKKVIVGGGDTGGFVNKYNNNFTHISTGGGASIEYISTNNLIGLQYF